MKKLSLYFALWIFVLLACTSEEIFHPTPAPALTITANPTQLAIPPEFGASGDSRQLVRYLLETNGGCKLPCWWGITPGKTTWRQARQILEKTSVYIDAQESQDDFYAKVGVSLPAPYDFVPFMEHIYHVKSGVVDYIRIYNFNLASNYVLDKILQAYGAPTEIWMRTFAQADQGAQDFLIDLFYQDTGILLEYRTAEPLQEVDHKLQNCLIPTMDAPVIHLWSTETQILTFEDVKQFLDRANLPEPKPLLAATGMDVQTFYETFKEPDSAVCLETPKDLWP